MLRSSLAATRAASVGGSGLDMQRAPSERVRPAIEGLEGSQRPPCPSLSVASEKESGMRAPDHVIQLFEEVSDRISSRDLSGSVELFDLTSDVDIIGSEEGYGAKGADDVPGFFRKLYGRDASFA